MDIHKGMSSEEYEGCYHEALLLLHEKYDSVGEPYQKDGRRVCQVETLVIDDHTVFLLAWGLQIANQIEFYSTDQARPGLRILPTAAEGAVELNE